MISIEKFKGRNNKFPKIVYTVNMESSWMIYIEEAVGQLFIVVYSDYLSFSCSWIISGEQSKDNIIERIK